MPRVFLKTKTGSGSKTITPCIICGKEIKPGERYYTWKPNYADRAIQHASHGAPLRSRLSPGSKFAEVWDEVDTLNLGECETIDAIKLALDGVANAARAVAARYVTAAESVERAWPAGNPTSVACRATASGLEAWAEELDGWEPVDAYDGIEITGGEFEQYLEVIRGEAMELIEDQPEYQG